MVLVRNSCPLFVVLNDDMLKLILDASSFTYVTRDETVDVVFAEPPPPTGLKDDMLKLSVDASSLI